MLGWYRVASHLGKTVNELRERITFTEFLGWLDFLEMEEGRNTKTDYYFAQLAAEIRRGNVAHPNKVAIKDFILKMSIPSENKKKDSKQVWLSLLKVKV